MKKSDFQKLESKIIRCVRCPRLRSHCETVAREKRKSFENWKYWGKPVPNFGDPKAELLIVGLAPAAHGANRTGRMFTGDRSGEWLYRALHRAGFANQPNSDSAEDGLKLISCLITATAHCAPPDNKPLPKEIAACEEFLTETFRITPAKVILALGGIAWDAAWKQIEKLEWQQSRKPKFGHGVSVELKDGRRLLGSYHPSQQNTFTGRLIEKMFDDIFAKAAELLR